MKVDELSHRTKLFIYTMGMEQQSMTEKDSGFLNNDIQQEHFSIL